MLPGTETLNAMQASAIDATEWIGPCNDLAFDPRTVAKHYCYPG